ncbi:hypothetical protein BBJ29_007971 [Phytophthora kernoviae]|uniref:Rab-GAP TBC domain-containing protein n=1 Tax=Phytophthora kernoviae TaxID=325452 RepID=A0A3F2RLQ9_9STRA|nr:hypothetical protein BBJ29_007971 [Phytophthora kernoviae]RLN59000.1 hypothetical protein BBP00_00006731 [Phytophthora kernoviae]
MMLEKNANETNTMDPEDAERSAVKDKSDAAVREALPTSPPSDTQQLKAEEAEPKLMAVAFPMTPIDRYGFLVTDKRFNRGHTAAGTYKHAVWLENRRTQKWVKMIGKQLEDWEVCQLRQAVTLKKRVRKGIPEALRGRVWSHLAGSSQMLLNNPGVYHQLLQTSHVPCEETIARDIGRTFPRHSLFRDRSSLGQCALMNVLKAYSLHDPEVGYCQGMGFLSAMFLCYMPEQQAFWLLVACLNHKRYGLADLYRPRMPKVPEVTFVFEGLFKQLMPQLSAHLENEGLHPTMYLTQWFLTLFTYNFPFEFVTRVWDAFLHEGWKIIFRVALALLKTSQKTLLSSKFEAIMEYFRELPNRVDAEEVLAVAFRVSIKREQIENLLEQYHNSNAGS